MEKNFRYSSISLLSLILVVALFEVTSGANDEMVGIYSKGSQPGHYLYWNGKAVLLVGDSVTQGWMELGTSFNQKAYVDALSSEGINLMMIWSYIGTNAEKQKKDSRIGYDAPEIWPWEGSPERKTFDLTKFNQAYFERLKDLVAYAEKKECRQNSIAIEGWNPYRISGIEKKQSI